MGNKLSIFLDSGAPSLYNSLARTNKGATFMGSYLKDRKNDDFSFVYSDAYLKYRQAYVDFLKKNYQKFDVYVNLDIINNGEETWKNQVFIEKEGLHPLPVFHLGEDIKWLKFYLNKGYNYIAIGGLIPNPYKVLAPALDELWAKYLTDKKGYPIVRIHGFALTSVRLMVRYPWFCMTEEEHTVLTKEGWKSLSDLSVGQEILSFNNGRTEWQEIEEIPIFKVKDQQIYYLHNRNFDAFVSENHRWLVSNDHGRGTNRVFKITKELGLGDCIDKVGKGYMFPTKSVYTDEQVKLLAWFWTDGTISHREKKYKKNSIRIYQSEKANPEKCEIIRNLLKKSKEKYCEGKSIDGLICFEMYGDITEWILSITKDKELPNYLPYRLTKVQIEQFVYNSVLADGAKGRLKRRLDGFVITVSRECKKKNLEILRQMCLLLGIPTSVYYGQNGKYKSLRSSSVNRVYIGKGEKEKITYTGRLWCVKVPTGAFFTKCREKIYVTGNSVDSASWVKYAIYGIVVLPKLTVRGVRDWKTSPESIFFSNKSNKRFEEGGRHYETFSNLEKKYFSDYLKEYGCRVGVS